MPYYIRDPKRDHNFDNHPCIKDPSLDNNKSPSPEAHCGSLPALLVPGSGSCNGGLKARPGSNLGMGALFGLKGVYKGS